MTSYLTVFRVLTAVMLFLEGILFLSNHSFQIIFISVSFEQIDATICNSVCPTFGGSDPGIRAEFVHSLKEVLSVMCGFSCSRHPSAFTALSVSAPALFLCILSCFLFEHTPHC